MDSRLHLRATKSVSMQARHTAHDRWHVQWEWCRWWSPGHVPSDDHRIMYLVVLVPQPLQQLEAGADLWIIPDVRRKPFVQETRVLPAVACSTGSTVLADAEHALHTERHSPSRSSTCNQSTCWQTSDWQEQSCGLTQQDFCRTRYKFTATADAAGERL